MPRFSSWSSPRNRERLLYNLHDWVPACAGMTLRGDIAREVRSSLYSMIDVHVHYFPPAVFRAIWRYFESKSLGLWKIRYKEHTDRHIATLRSHGVTRFTTLVYAHKPGLADHLNEFIVEQSKEHAEIIPFGTIYAGDGDVKMRARRLFEDYGFAGIKLHPFVSREQLDDARYFPAYEIMEALGKVVVCHPGSGPVYEHTDGADRLERILQKFPNLKVVIAHCGAFEYGDYPRLAREYPHVYFDTAMNCVHHAPFHNNCPGKNFFLEFRERLLYGSDFPNIPYDYGEQANSLRALQLGSEIEAQIFSGNARRLFGIKETV